MEPTPDAAEAARAEGAARQVAELRAQLAAALKERDAALALKNAALAPYVDRTGRALRLLKESHAEELARYKRQRALADATHRSELRYLRTRADTVRTSNRTVRQSLVRSEAAWAELEAELAELHAGGRRSGGDGGAGFVDGDELPSLQEVAMAVREFVGDRFGPEALHAYGGQDLPTVIGSNPGGMGAAVPRAANGAAELPDALQGSAAAGHAAAAESKASESDAGTGADVGAGGEIMRGAAGVGGAEREYAGGVARLDVVTDADVESSEDSDGDDADEKAMMKSPTSNSANDLADDVPLSELRHHVDEAIGNADHVFVLRTLIHAKQSEEAETLGACLNALVSYETTFDSPNLGVAVERLRRELEQVELKQSATQRVKIEKEIKALEVDITHLKALLSAGLLADISKLSELEQKHRAAVYNMHQQDQDSPSGSPTAAEAGAPQALQLDPRIKTHAIGDRTADLRPSALPTSARAGWGSVRRFSVSAPPMSGGSARSTTPRSNASSGSPSSASSVDEHGFGLGRRMRGANTRYCKDLGVSMPPTNPKWLALVSSDAIDAAYAALNGASGNELACVECAVDLLWPGLQHTGAIKRACEANDAPLSSPSQLKILLNYLRFFNDQWAVLDDVETIDGSQMTVQAFKEGCAAVGYAISPSEEAATYVQLDRADTGFVVFSDFCTFLARRVTEKETNDAAQNSGSKWGAVMGTVAATSSPPKAARPVRTSEFSLSDIEAEINAKIAADKSSETTKETVKAQAVIGIMWPGSLSPTLNIEDEDIIEEDEDEDGSNDFDNTPLQQAIHAQLEPEHEPEPESEPTPEPEPEVEPVSAPAPVPAPEHVPETVDTEAEEAAHIAAAEAEVAEAARVAAVETEVATVAAAKGDAEAARVAAAEAEAVEAEVVEAVRVAAAEVDAAQVVAAEAEAPRVAARVAATEAEVARVAVAEAGAAKAAAEQAKQRATAAEPEPQAESPRSPRSSHSPRSRGTPRATAAVGAVAIAKGGPPTQRANVAKSASSPKSPRSLKGSNGHPTSATANADNSEFLLLVPADLRADLDRATQAEAAGNLSEALSIYTDCIRRLAPVYKRKLNSMQQLRPDRFLTSKRCVPVVCLQKTSS